jgi:hypothetical protein
VGNYTGDASWGAFGVAFAPGEVPLTPGETYAIELESLENIETLRGFINIKGQESDARAGFNPYRKPDLDPYERGTAFKDGAEAMPFDLDMQIIEYAWDAPDWAMATTGPNRLINGDMEDFGRAESAEIEPGPPPRGASGYLPTGRGVGRSLTGWREFRLDSDTRFAVMAESEPGTNHVGRVFALGGQTADGGWVQRVEGLNTTETYRLTGRVRASWAVDFEHQVLVGVDRTGQDSDPGAASIEWSRLPPRHGVFVEHTSPATRPATNALSVWLRARTTWKGDPYAPFKADFDAFSLRAIRTTPPEAKSE